MAGLLLPAMALAQLSELPVGTRVIGLRPEIYQQVLDLLFTPKEETPKLVAFTIRLRVSPFSRPDSQVNVTFLKDRTVKAEYVATDRSVASANTEFVPPTPEGLIDETRDYVEGDAESVAKRTPVKRYALNASPALALKWQQDLLRSLSPAFLALQPDLRRWLLGKHIMVSMTAVYDVWYSQFPMDFHVSFSPSPKATALGRWAEALHSEAANMALQPSR